MMKIFKCEFSAREASECNFIFVVLMGDLLGVSSTRSRTVFVLSIYMFV